VGGEEKRGWAARPTTRAPLAWDKASSSRADRGNETDVEDEHEVEDHMRKPSSSGALLLYC